MVAPTWKCSKWRGLSVFVDLSQDTKAENDVKTLQQPNHARVQNDCITHRAIKDILFVVAGIRDVLHDGLSR